MVFRSADSDAEIIQHWLFQMATYNDYSFIIDTASGRQFLQLWFLILLYSWKYSEHLTLLQLLLLHFLVLSSIYVIL